MVYNSRSLRQALADAQQLLTAMRAEQARSEALVSQLYRAQAAQRQTELAYEQALQQCALLRERLGLQQEAIVLLLSIYPEPLREKLLRRLAA